MTLGKLLHGRRQFANPTVWLSACFHTLSLKIVLFSKLAPSGLTHVVNRNVGGSLPACIELCKEPTSGFGRKVFGVEAAQQPIADQCSALQSRSQIVGDRQDRIFYTFAFVGRK